LAHLSHVAGEGVGADTKTADAAGSADTKSNETSAAATTLEIGDSASNTTEGEIGTTEAPTMLGSCCCGGQKKVEEDTIIDTPFMQQAVPKRQVYVTSRGSVAAHMVIGTLLLVFGGIIYDASEKVVYMDASYSGRDKASEGSYGAGKAFYFHETCTSLLKDSYGNVTGNMNSTTGESIPMEYYDVVTGTTCDVTFYVPYKMTAPVVVFYRLTDFYQNVFSYFKSRDSMQLYGYDANPDACLAGSGLFNDGDHTKFLNVGRNIDDCNVDEGENCEYLYPCGLVSNSFFNDTFDLKYSSVGQTCDCSSLDASDKRVSDDFDCDKCEVWPPAGQTSADIYSQEDLGWTSDDDVYSAHDKYGTYSNTRYLNESYPSLINDNGDENQRGLQDDRYMLWMRPAAFSDFKKTYAKYDYDIPADSQVTFTVTSRFPSFFYDGRKHLVIASSNWQGPTKSEVMPWLFMGFGIYAWVAAFATLTKIFTCPRSKGSEKLMEQLHEDGHIKEYIPKDEFGAISMIKGMITRET